MRVILLRSSEVKQNVALLIKCPRSMLLEGADHT